MIAKRSSIAALVLSASVLVGIAVKEMYVGEAYIPVPGDVPTLGYGETKGVKMGQTTTPDRALVQLLASASGYAQGVKSCVTVPLHQYEFDAYVSLSYNIGTGAFCRSTLVKLANAGDYSGACKQILKWDKAGGRVLRGLTNRRRAEYATCIGAGA